MGDITKLQIGITIRNSPTSCGLNSFTCSRKNGIKIVIEANETKTRNIAVVEKANTRFLKISSPISCVRRLFSKYKNRPNRNNDPNSNIYFNSE